MILCTTLVPKKGLEPPHPCGYMDLNHARLPIPPLRQGDAPDNHPALRQEDLSILKGLRNVSNHRVVRYCTVSIPYENTSSRRPLSERALSSTREYRGPQAAPVLCGLGWEQGGGTLRLLVKIQTARLWEAGIGSAAHEVDVSFPLWFASDGLKSFGVFAWPLS